MLKEAWAVYMTLFDLSIALKELNVSHNIIEFSEYQLNNGKSRHRYKNINLGFPQPAMPFLLSTIADIPKLYRIEYPCIAFVAASQHEISISNIRSLERTENLIHDVKYALTESLKSSNFILEYNEPTLMDYVKVASKPSILNQIQNAWYKINPYSDRKIVQNTVIQYLSGVITLTRAKSVLSKTMKMQLIGDMLTTSEATNLKLATIEAKSKGGVAEIAENYNIDPFDINYLLALRNKSIVKSNKKRD